MDRSVENTAGHFSLKVAFSRHLLYRTSLENYILLSFIIVKKVLLISYEKKSRKSSVKFLIFNHRVVSVNS